MKLDPTAAANLREFLELSSEDDWIGSPEATLVAAAARMIEESTGDNNQTYSITNPEAVALVAFSVRMLECFRTALERQAANSTPTTIN